MRELLKAVIDSRRESEKLKAELGAAEKKRDESEKDLIEAMEAQGLNSLDFKGVGRATIGKPRLYASCNRENQERLFVYLDEDCGRGDLIRKTVFPATLSSFVTERMEAGEQVPEFISVYFKPSLIVKTK